MPGSTVVHRGYRIHWSDAQITATTDDAQAICIATEIPITHVWSVVVAHEVAGEDVAFDLWDRDHAETLVELIARLWAGATA
jgi:hypothetical protein